MEKKLFLTYSSSLTDLQEVNSSFDSGILRIAYHGKNRNKTEISKSAFKDAMKSMYNVPIVCNYDRDTDSIGAHDIELVSDDKGVRIVNITTPIGVVPESAKTFWQTVKEEDGSEHEYLCSEVLLWKRQEAYDKIKDNGVTAHSMEINVFDGETIDGYYNIKKFEFTAFAIIGVEPCFESASLQLFSKKDFELQFSQMMEEMKECFSKVTPSLGVDISPKILTEGGKDALENENIPVNEGEEFELHSNLYEELMRAVRAEKVTTEWGEYPRYSYQDYDPESGNVYFWDTSDWLLYGCPYSMNGDVVSLNWGCKKRKKFVIADFDEGEDQTSPFYAMSEQCCNAASEATSKASEFEQKYNEANTELESLRQFKACTELESLRNEKLSVLDKFSALAGIQEYEDLKLDDAGFDITEIEEKCFAIKGRHDIKFEYSVNQDANRIVVTPHHENEQNDEPYNGLFKKYLK